MLRCSQNLLVSGAGPIEVTAVDSFRVALIRMEGGTEPVLKAAEEAPDCTLLQTYAAFYSLYAGTRAGNSEAIAWIERAAHAANDATEREKMLLEAATRWYHGDVEAMLDLLEAVTREHPQDHIAAKVAEFGYYLAGQHYQAPRFLAHMERIAPANEDEPDILAMYSFACELSGRYDEARRYAEDAVAQRFATPWAHHALAHIALVTDELQRGLEEQNAFLPTWTDPGSTIHGHNGWHLAVLRLLAGDLDGTLALFDDLVWGNLPSSTTEQVDAISLLWRIEMAGAKIPAEQWRKIAVACAPLAHEALTPFVTAHHAYAFARARFHDELKSLREAMHETAAAAPRERALAWKKAGIPVTQASVAAAQDDPGGVVEALYDRAREIPRVGGSDAQDDLWRQALVHALLALGRETDARDLLQVFPGTRPTTRLLC